MSQWDKLIERILKLSNDVRFEEIRKIMVTLGYTVSNPRGGSSHYTFRKRGRTPITVPKHGPIKKAYVEKVRKIVEEELKNENGQ